MKKILIISDNSISQISGVLTSLEKTVEILRQKGHNVKIIDHSLFKSFSLKPWFPEMLISFFVGKTLRNAIINEKPEHIHIITEGMLGYKARMICVKNKIKFTTAYHTHYDLYLKERVNNLLFKIVRSYLRWFHEKSEAVMVSTESLKKELEEKGYKKIVICPLGVDIDFFKKTENINTKYTKPIFAYLGRLAKEKNVEEYLKCNLPGTKLIIGDGPERKKLEQDHGTKAIFLGKKTGKELVELLSQTDVLVFPSITDTFGLAIVEALACGVPVSGHNIMGPKDILTHGVDGFLDENLEKASIECLKLDKSKCRKKAEQFSWEHSVETFLKNLK